MGALLYTKKKDGIFIHPCGPQNRVYGAGSFLDTYVVKHMDFGACSPQFFVFADSFGCQFDINIHEQLADHSSMFLLLWGQKRTSMMKKFQK